MASSAPRFSIDSLSPTSPSNSRGEYPFPRPSSNGRFQLRRGSTASSIHSIGGVLDTSSHWHDLKESSQNAISTLLQPPIVRTGLLPHTSAPASSAHKPPTARDIPPVTLTNIPHVDPSEFKPYLTQVGGLYDALQRAKENEDDGGTQLFRKGKSDDFSDLLESDRKSASRPNLSRKASLASLASSIEAPGIKRRTSGGPGRRAAHATTPLSTIPNVYFEEDFHLENPRTFDVVSERSEVVKPVPGSPDERRASNGVAVGQRKALATNAILQEKLSWYMDTIEVHLISSISTASTSFFEALGSLRELHHEAAESVDRIKTLRKELATLDKEMAVGGLNIVKKKRRKENLKQLSDAVQQLKEIVEGLANCESLVDEGDVDKALDAIDGLERLISGVASKDTKIQLRDLRRTAALNSVDDDLDLLRLRIGKLYETKFLNALIGDLRHHVESVSTSDTLQRWSSSSKRSRGGHTRESSVPAYLTIDDQFRTELSGNLSGLHRARHTSPATTAYREAVLRELRNIIRRPLPASNDDDADSMMSASTMGGGRQKTQQEKSSILARNLRALEPEDAEDLLRKTYIGVGETLRRLGTQVKVLLDVTSTLGDPASGLRSPPRSPNVAAIDGRLSSPSSRGNSGREIQEEMHQALDMSNLLGQAVDIAHDKIVKVLRVRSEQSTHLSVTNFLRYFTLNLLFANECEAVSGKSGTALKNVVNGHIKDFVQQMSESERQALATGMEADPWNAKDFTDTDSEELTRILSASTEDAEAWTSGNKIWQPNSPPPPLETTATLLAAQVNGNSGTSTPSTAPTKAVIRSAHIDSESFILPTSAHLCLHGLSSFLHLTTGIPSMTSEIATSITSYLSLFNSRCTQLILGAGATRSAGLKNITTKHLALAAQALSFISTLIPHIREFVRRHSTAGPSTQTLMGEFDKVRRAYQEHQQSIYDKLVDIMAGRATAHIKAMKLINWELKDNEEVNKYMETLTKETSTLHRVLSKHLPEMTVMMIMEPVFKSYREQWGKAFEGVVLGSEGAQARMLRDAEHFGTKIGGLDGAGDTGEYLVNLIKAKNVPKAKVATPSPPPTPAKAADKEESNEEDNEKDAIADKKQALANGNGNGNSGTDEEINKATVSELEKAQTSAV
ncbi:related to VPS54-subunit of VP51-54 complex, required for protein sorting at the yeast late Golgi [Rhynchosporium secalis]|uniref:Vacuolar protein sorting-associated protein 54 n=1 Tax=Rhynchosporium secalis TaxID=38038 RepID=A0A1E1MKD7_RHYSE|nr:related to VPS54-subunit of VP51-54 complex, required for protein sorting at the yeast late Golgi [Rhynchosporium secalis]